MLKINTKVKKYKIPLLFVCLGLGGFFLLQYLTFIPEYSVAESISTPVYNEDKEDTRTLSQIDTMQEMTTGVCNRSQNGETARLEDVRASSDGKTRMYWVAKLIGGTNDEDSRCWMTQNLDYDLFGELLPETSDVGDKRTPVMSTMNNTDFLNWGEYDSYDPGDYTNAQISYYVDCDYKKYGDACTNWKQLDNSWSPYTTIVSGDGIDTINEITHQYDAHYLVGNYYTYTAATLGSDGKESICPKGWTIPTSAEYSVLIMRNILSIAVARISPNYYIPGGFATYGGMNGVGNSGYYWTSTRASAQSPSNYASFMSLASSGVNISDYYTYYGYSVRCINNLNVFDVPAVPDIDNSNILISVPNIITLDVYSNEEDKEDKIVDIETNSSDISTGTFIAEVSANANYNVLLNATSEADDATSLIGRKEDGTVNNQLIPTITTEQPRAGASSWGIRACASLLEDSCDTTLYRPLPTYSTSGDAAIFYTGTPTFSTKTMFQIGIGVAPDLPSGTYTTEIRVTAVTAD